LRRIHHRHRHRRRRRRRRRHRLADFSFRTSAAVSSRSGEQSSRKPGQYRGRMDNTADPQRASDVGTIGSESDETSSASNVRTVNDGSSTPATAGTVPSTALDAAATNPIECRDRAPVRAMSPGSYATPAASCPSTLSAMMLQQQQQQKRKQQKPLLTQPGCGCVVTAASTPTNKDEITVCITPTTGGQFEITADRNDTVESLKKNISKKLKVAKERICLLHRER